MSPAATRRYIVGFKGWTMYETVVLANSESEAIAKGVALYHLDGLAGFSLGDSGEEPWQARYLDGEVRS